MKIGTGVQIVVALRSALARHGAKDTTEADSPHGRSWRMRRGLAGGSFDHKDFQEFRAEEAMERIQLGFIIGQR